MDLSVLTLDFVDDVAVVTMNNPPVNALGPESLADFEQILQRLQMPGVARALLLTSACPGFFSAGDDVKGLKDIDDSLLALHPRGLAMIDTLEALPLPTVAGIDGHALGGGLELALACDFRFMAADSGTIGLPEVRLGMIPAFGGTQRLPQVVGKAKAIEMMLKGLAISAEQAAEIGLVNGIFPKDSLYEQSLDYAKRLARQATAAIGRIKSCVNVGLREGFARGMAEEARAFRANIVSDDAKEGVEAFLAARKPVFTGRG